MTQMRQKGVSLGCVYMSEYACTCVWVSVSKNERKEVEGFPEKTTHDDIWYLIVYSPSGNLDEKISSLTSKICFHNQFQDSERCLVVAYYN